MFIETKHKPRPIRPAAEPGSLAAVQAVRMLDCEPVPAALVGGIEPEIAALAERGEQLLQEWEAAGHPGRWRPTR
ncbi:MAG: hypothetical protein ACR2FY_14635 [Pirellulaceae bacterium]